MLKTVTIALKDLFDRKIFFVSLLPLFFSAFVWSGIFWVWSESIDLFFTYILSHIPYIGTSKWLKQGIEAVSGFFAYYQLVIITSMMLVGLVSDRVVDRINEKYYHLERRGFGTTRGSVFVSLKQNIIFFMLFVLAIPLMFIPVVNVITNIALWAILIKEPLFYDSVAFYADKKEYRELKRSDKLETKILTYIGASIFLIPFLGVFVYILQLLIFAHFNLKRLKELRS